jgi:division protein CdvB (Snf7/Vps24/ESCRT-III family)
MNLIKPPFVIKSVIVPKKLRKKTKKKYLIKIVYKNENKRLKNAYKQLYYYSNKFTDSKVNIRLYKAFMFSFLE